VSTADANDRLFLLVQLNRHPDHLIADLLHVNLRRALDVAGQYHKAIAFTYRLADADSAARDLNAAIATLKQQMSAWRHT